MPQRGIAYQPRVPTLGILPEKETRVLKERRISARVPDIAPGLLYAVFLQNTPILSDEVPRVGTLGWYALPPSGQFAVPRAMPCLVCVAPLGQIEQWHFGSRVHAPTGHRVPTCRRGAVGANSATTFSIPCPKGASHTSPGCKPWESSRKKKPAF